MNNYKKPTLEVIDIDIKNIIMASTSTDCDFDSGYDDGKAQGARSATVDYYS